MPNDKVTDSIVSYPDAVAWAVELMNSPTTALEAQLMELEPAVLGLAMHSADTVLTLLIRSGIRGPLALKVADAVLRTGAICCEMTRRGYGKFLVDLLEPGHGNEPMADGTGGPA